jgi:hypothetical protein
MAHRACKPDADLKRIWQILLPDTPFPACGVAEDASSPARENASPAKEPHDAVKTSRIELMGSRDWQALGH